MTEFDYLGRRLDLTVGHSEVPRTHCAASPRPTEKFVGIRFLCCGTYARIRLNRLGNAYQGHCPKCSRPVRVEIAPGGTDTRFFEVG